MHGSQTRHMLREESQSKSQANKSHVSLQQIKKEAKEFKTQECLPESSILQCDISLNDRIVGKMCCQATLAFVQIPWKRLPQTQTEQSNTHLSLRVQQIDLVGSARPRSPDTFWQVIPSTNSLCGVSRNSSTAVTSALETHYALFMLCNK